MSDELKPCPFCGSQDVAMMSRYGGGEHFCIKCNDCWAKSIYVPEHAKDQAVKAWNKRTAQEGTRQ